MTRNGAANRDSRLNSGGGMRSGMYEAFVAARAVADNRGEPMPSAPVVQAAVWTYLACQPHQLIPPPDGCPAQCGMPHCVRPAGHPIHQ